MKRLALALLLVVSAQAQLVNLRVARVIFGTLSAVSTTAGFDVSLLSPSQHTVQVITAGSPASCSLQLEGSLDGGTTWANLSGAQTCTSSVTFHVIQKPIDMVRINVTALSAAASVTVRYVGVQ